jgi:hypothetical protein
MIFQNIVEDYLTLSKENTLGSSEVMSKEGKTNAADLYILKLSQVLRIHAKGKKQLRRLRGRFGKELCYSCNLGLFWSEMVWNELGCNTLLS